LIPIVFCYGTDPNRLKMVDLVWIDISRNVKFDRKSTQIDELSFTILVLVILWAKLEFLEFELV